MIRALLLLALLTCPALARADDAPLLLQAEGEHKTVDCAGRDVRIEGNRNRYMLRGGCLSVVLRGEADEIRAEMAPGGRIDVEGNGVLLFWSKRGDGPDPSVSLNGAGSRVMALDAGPATTPAQVEARITAPQAPPRSLPVLTGPVIELRVSNEARDLDCGGRAVRIAADGGIYALRGGCRALVVTGQNNLVQAEMAPGARITASGADTRVAWVLANGGAAPDVKRSDGAKVWQIPALGDWHDPD